MDFSPQQTKAISMIMDWKKSFNYPFFYLAGYAGTGKTTIARHIAEKFGGKAVYMAYTGKAAVVMRKSGCFGAATIHSTIYKSKQDPVTGKFKQKFDHHGACSTANVIIIDEASMVDEYIAKDILRYGKPIIVLGDPAQLPPVRGAGFFTADEPNMMLTEIHRQAEDNPIIKLATSVRMGESLLHGSYGASSVIDKAEFAPENILKANQVLIGKNRTRQLYNNRMRELLGREGLLPVAGDRVVCLKNDHGMGLFNGGIHTVVKVGKGPDDKHIEIVVKSEDFPEHDFVEAIVRKEFFQGGYANIDWKELRGTQQFTYGYALTVHKSQGSQWDNVILFDESGAFGKDAKKHLYTGITRAAKTIQIVT